MDDSHRERQNSKRLANEKETENKKFTCSAVLMIVGIFYLSCFIYMASQGNYDT